MNTSSNDICRPSVRVMAGNADSPESHYALGRSLILAGDLGRGWIHLQRALTLKPDFALPRVLWGQLLLQRGQHADALDSFRRAEEADPRCVDARLGVGTVLCLCGKAGAAVDSFDAAIAIAPAQARAHLLRGWALRQCSRLDEAALSLERALRLQPDLPQALSEALLCYAWMCEWTAFERLVARLRRIPGALANVEPSNVLMFSDDPAEHAVAARSQAARAAGGKAPLPPPRRYDHGRIRIAYVSHDFHAHATAFLMAELFELHQRSEFEIFAISFSGDDGSAVRRRITRACDRFIEMGERSDAEVARWLREQEVDIAIDLKGFTGFARPGVFALRPAPIQVSYLGQPGTSGAPYIDYLIADEFLIPSEARRYYSEKVAYLPDSYQVNDRQRAVAAETPARAAVGLPELGVVFCCFNNNWKITAPVFDVWMRILRAVDGSVLWLLGDNPPAIENLRREAARYGVSADRLVFADRIANELHLARHRLADLFLDTLPCNAHTTASDALWSGVPVITCSGRSFPARVAGSLLRAVGLEELVTHSLAQYETLALELARDAQRLSAIRARLAAGREQLPLFDTPRFCRHLEQAYRRMWQRHRDGEPPVTFRVEPSAAPASAA
jgi:predicted O-linked N-acetylglucosamine transferase (SPINDLY family)